MTDNADPLKNSLPSSDVASSGADAQLADDSTQLPEASEVAPVAIATVRNYQVGQGNQEEKKKPRCGKPALLGSAVEPAALIDDTPDRLRLRKPAQRVGQLDLAARPQASLRQQGEHGRREDVASHDGVLAGRLIHGRLFHHVEDAVNPPLDHLRPDDA